MGNYVDLHIHSMASDGTCTPAEDVRMAVKAGLSAMALTDHDTVNGISEARMALEQIKKENPEVKMELVPGIEFSAGYKGKDIHILGHFIDINNQKLLETIERTVKEREHRNQKMIGLFADLGIAISIEDLYEGNPQTVVTRAHFSRALIKKGIVKDKEEAFGKYLSYDAPCYVPRAYLTPEEVIEVITGAGGVPTLAHPFLYELPDEELRTLIERLVNAGLKGIEVLHSTNKRGDEDVLRGICAKYNLCMSGGSDFHGKNKPDIQIGIGRGNLRVPESFLESIKRKRNEMKL